MGARDRVLRRGQAAGSGKCAAITTTPIPGLKNATPTRKNPRTELNHGANDAAGSARGLLRRDSALHGIGQGVFDRATSRSPLCAKQTFDLAVIGGGINGAAIARDAAMRGLRVALIDRGDFAGATSSRSSKLIHGGFRYLPQGQLRLVYEALRERERLRHVTAPHLVRPLRFLFPLYAGTGGVAGLRWAPGLFLYDLLARTEPAYRHRRLSAAEMTGMEPQLNPAGLQGGALYYDGHGDDARLTLENALDAVLHGAAAVNYVALQGFDRHAGQLTAALVSDVLGADCFALRAGVFVNAAGPWIDDVRRMAEPQAHPTIRLTKGVHLVLGARFPLRNSLVLSDGQGRIVFLIRDADSTLLGTTDTDFAGGRGQVRASAEDVDYLLQVAARALPGAGIGRGDILTTFAGLRALVAGDGTRAPSTVPREELIIKGAGGMVSIAGGKLTTHRRIAERVVDMVCRELGRPVRESPTLSTPLPGARPTPPPAGSGNLIPLPVRTGLAMRYGSRMGKIDALIAQDQHLAEPLSAGCPVIAAEALHAARSEMAQKLEDFMIRRTPMAWRYPAHAAGAAREAARLMGKELGWSTEREASELAEFETALKASRTI